MNCPFSSSLLGFALPTNLVFLQVCSNSHSLRVKYDVMSHNTAAAPPSSGVYFTLNGTTLLSGDNISIRDVGPQPDGRTNPGKTLVCVTTNVNENCCRNKDNMNRGAIGTWLYPNKSAVATPATINQRNNTFVRYVHHNQVRLASEGDPSGPAGEYTCLVPTTSGRNVSAIINVVIAAMGKNSFKT